MAVDKTEKKGGKRGRGASFRDTGKTTASGLSVFSGKTKITADSPDIVFEFNVPPRSMVTFKGLDTPTTDKFYGDLVNGAYTHASRSVRVEFDTRIKYRGVWTDALSMKPSMLARILNNVYQNATDQGKFVDPENKNYSPKVPSRLANIAARAVHDKIVSRNDVNEPDEKLKHDVVISTFVALPQTAEPTKK